MIMVICNGRARTRPSGEAVGLFEELKKALAPSWLGGPREAEHAAKTIAKSRAANLLAAKRHRDASDGALKRAAACIGPARFMHIPVKPRKAGLDPSEKRQLLRRIDPQKMSWR